MKALVVYAHPDSPEESHSSFTLKEMIAALDKAKIEHEIIDLYKINYDPVLHENEHRDWGKGEISQQNREFQEKIRSADSLVFIYPVWWGDTPAILKGFLDKVFTTGFAFSYEQGGLLKGKKAAVMMTMGEADKLPGKMMKDYRLDSCGIEAKVFLVGNAHGSINDERKAMIQANVKKAVRFLKKKEAPAQPAAQQAPQPSQPQAPSQQPAPAPSQ